MQAVFAGVNHGERPLRRRRTRPPRTELARLSAKRGGRTGGPRSLPPEGRRGDAAARGERCARRSMPRLNEEVFFPWTQWRVRFTIPPAVPEPCHRRTGNLRRSRQNVALASKGAKPTASGTLPGYDIHKLEHLNDGQPATTAAGSPTRRPGWVQIDLPGQDPHPAHRLGPRPLGAIPRGPRRHSAIGSKPPRSLRNGAPSPVPMTVCPSTAPKIPNRFPEPAFRRGCRGGPAGSSQTSRP